MFLDILRVALEWFIGPEVLRRALYGGFCGSVGATLGWVLWVSGYAFQSRPDEILRSTVVGAVLGILIDQVKAYVQAGREHREEQRGKSKVSTLGKSRARRISEVVGWMTGVSAIALTAVVTSLLPELIEPVIRPFIASVVVLFPVGAVFGTVFNAPRPEDHLNPLDGIFGPITGSIIGCLAALVANGMYFLMGASFSNAALGWWTLMGCGMGFAWSTFGRPHPTVPALGAVLSMGMTLVAMSPIEVSMRHVQGLKGVSQIIPISVEALLTAPDLPARFWIEAETSLRNLPVTNSQSLESPIGESIANRLGCNDPAPGALIPPPPAYYERRAKICANLQAGWSSALWRSWLVMLFYGVGLGLAKVFDVQLRPEEYSSVAEERDRRAAWFICLVLVGAVLLIRIL